MYAARQAVAAATPPLAPIDCVGLLASTGASHPPPPAGVGLWPNGRSVVQWLGIRLASANESSIRMGCNCGTYRRAARGQPRLPCLSRPPKRLPLRRGPSAGPHFLIGSDLREPHLSDIPKTPFKFLSCRPSPHTQPVSARMQGQRSDVV